MKDSFILTRENILFYRKNGYLVIPNILTEEQCDRINGIFEKHAKDNNNTDFRGIMNLDRDNYQIRNVMCYYKIVLILDTLQDAEVVGLQSMFLFKKGGTNYAPQAWNPHQDNAYPRAPHGMYLTGNLAFTDQDKENGCMFIYPGSHNEQLIQAEFHQSFHEPTGKNPGHDVSNNMPSEYKAVDLPMQKGSLLILHGNVVHGSYPNISKRDRPMLLIPYGTKGITQHPNFIPGKTGDRKEFSLRPLRYEL